MPCPIHRGENEGAPRSENASAFGYEPCGITDVVNRLERNYYVEAMACKRKVHSV